MAQQQSLRSQRIAILVTDGVEKVELTDPKQALERVGARTAVIAPHGGQIKAWNHGNWDDTIEVDLAIEQADPHDFDALLLPGGVLNADKLRMNDQMVAFAREMAQEGKPIAAICHGPWLLVEAGLAHGKTLTSYPSLKTDIRNAGGTWVDREVVVDQRIVTSRTPQDLPAFDREMVTLFAACHQERQHERATREPEQPEDVVAAASVESFPASDPPAWTPSSPTPERPQEQG